MSDKLRIEKTVFSYMEKHQMVSPGHRVLAGVSGGADSVCLLFLLLEYKKQVPFELAVVHVNHGIREDAGDDAEFVKNLCRQVGVDFYLKQVNVREVADQAKCSIEEAARILRYQAFQEVAMEFGGDRIAVAHNGNDQAETLLFHLFRGSGIKGLSAIRPVRDQIIRPLLCLERREIESYLAERGISYCTDSTNGEDSYTRNRIRHHILPLAEQEVSPRAVAHMCRTADTLAELEEYLEQQTTRAREQCVEPLTVDSDLLTVDVKRFLQLHIALQKRLVLTLLQELAPGGRDISSVHVESVLSLFTKEGNPQLDLPYGIIAVRRYDRVLLETGKTLSDEADNPMSQGVELPQGESELPLYIDLGGGSKAEVSIFFANNHEKIPHNRYTKWFDCDKIIKSPVFRFRLSGDYLTLSDGRGGTIHKSLKDYMINEKIPQEDRGRIPVLAEGNHVLWLAGYRISEHYKVNGNTKRILQVKIVGGCFGSGTEE